MSGSSRSAVDACEPLLLQHRREAVSQLQRQVDALAGVVEHRVRRQFLETHRLRAAPADLLLGERLVAKVLERVFLDDVGRPRGVQQVARQHRVQGRRPAAGLPLAPAGAFRA